MNKNLQYSSIDLRMIFYINMLAIFVIGILLLAFAEPFKLNWIVGLGLGIATGFVITRLILKKI